MGSECQSYHHLHFVVVPFLCPGHLIPMVDIARLLAQHSAVVTIVTTPINATRITPMIELANESSNSQIRVVQIKVPSAEFGLPEGCESLELIPSRELLGNFFKSISKMQEPIEDLIEDLKPSPACLVVDKIHYWMELLGDGFEDRNKEKGLIIHGWAPQVLIFSHKAMGVFLTHCGWNSTLEAICAGVPMITFPMFADQFFNEKLIVEILRVGEALGNDVSTMPIGEQEQNHGGRIKREDIVEAIHKVVGEGTEKEERRERVRKLGELAKKSMEHGGSSYLNMEMLIDDIAKVALDKLTQ